MNFKWKLNDILILTILAAVLGVLWWGWSLIHAIFDGPLKVVHPGLPYLLSGLWVLGGTMIPAVIRRPGAALVGEFLASGFEGVISQWGLSALIWGGIQGAASETVFALRSYKYWGMSTLVLSGSFAGLAFWMTDLIYYNLYSFLPLPVLAIQLTISLTSGAILGGGLGWVIVKNLRQAGLVKD